MGGSRTIKMGSFIFFVFVFYGMEVSGMDMADLQQCILSRRDCWQDLEVCRAKEEKVCPPTEDCPKCQEAKKCPDPVVCPDFLTAEAMDDAFSAMGASLSRVDSKVEGATQEVMDSHAALNESVFDLHGRITKATSECPIKMEEVEKSLIGELRGLERKVAQWTNLLKKKSEGEVMELQDALAVKEDELQDSEVVLAQRQSCTQVYALVLRALRGEGNSTEDSFVEFAALEDSSVLDPRDNIYALCWDHFWPHVGVSAVVHVAFVLWLIVSCTLWWHRCCRKCCCVKKEKADRRSMSPDNGKKDEEQGDSEE